MAESVVTSYDSVNEDDGTTLCYPNWKTDHWTLSNGRTSATLTHWRRVFKNCHVVLNVPFGDPASNGKYMITLTEQCQHPNGPTDFQPHPLNKEIEEAMTRYGPLYNLSRIIEAGKETNPGDPVYRMSDTNQSMDKLNKVVDDTMESYKDDFEWIAFNKSVEESTKEFYKTVVPELEMQATPLNWLEDVD